jgi:hypothetical protein
MSEKTVKPGWKTSEFWQSLGGQILGGIAMVGDLPFLPPAVRGVVAIAGGVVTAVANGVYTISRAKAKQPQPMILNPVRPVP